MNYYKQLDGLRAIAIIGVMIAHWLQSSIKFELLRNIPYGTGVTLFFVISGFLITKILLDFKEKNIAEKKGQLKSIKSFYLRRSLRIFPIYYLIIIFLLLIGFKDTIKLFPWLASYTTNIYMTINHEYIGSFTHFWSLAVEEQFYLLWVFVIIFIPRKHLKKTILLTITISLLTLYYFVFFTKYWLANSLVICSMHTLGMGAIIAYYLKYEKDSFISLNLSKLKIVLLLLLVVFIIVYVYRKPDSLYNTFKEFKNPFVSIIYSIIVFIAIRNGFSGLMKKILESRLMIYIGRISYGLYIYHLFMGPLYFNFLHKYIGIEANDYGYFVIFFITNMTIASISWYLIEKPINGLKRYFNY